MNPAVYGPDGAVAVSPVQRLEASRERLRTALQAARGQKPPSFEDDEARPEGSFFDGLWRSGRRIWARHPARHAMRFASQTFGPQVKPFMREHSWRLIAMAIGLGVVIAWLRPWRLLPKAALSSVLLSVLLPRRAIWQELMSSRLVDRLASGEWLGQWLGPRARTDRSAEAPTENPGPNAPTRPKAEVLRPSKPATDAQRAA